MSVHEPLDVELYPGLSERQRCVLPAVLAAPTVKAGLEAAETSRTTWYRWLADPAVAETWRRLRREGYYEALGDLERATRFAVSGLLGLMTSKNEHVRLQACKEVLSLAIRAHELGEVEDRLTRIEAVLDPLIATAES